jgi:uncharacterized repeat protein (TIGR01451 family)
MKLIRSLLLALALTARFAHADDALTMTVEAHKVVRQADGKETFAPPDQAKTNDVLEYRTVYRNASGQVIEKAAATLPLPQGVEYIPNTATAKASASTDGRIFAPVPLVRVVSSPQGTREMEVVPPAEYRFLRWHLGDLPAGASSTVITRVRVSGDAAPTAVPGEPRN